MIIMPCNYYKYDTSVSKSPYFEYSNSTSELDVFFSQESKEARKNTAYYESKPILDVFTTDQYTHWSAWAHTEPERYVINIRPAEHLDDSLGVLPHEITHNFYPSLRNEDHVTQIGNGPAFRGYIENSFRYRFH